MKVFALFLSVLMIVAFIGGCDEGMDMMKPAMEDHTAPKSPMEPEAKPPVDPRDDGWYEKTRRTHNTRSGS